MSAMVKETPRGESGVLSGLAAEAMRRDSLLFRLAVAHLLLIPLMMLVAPFDERLVTGLNPWVKPIKFALANAVYVFTVGWLLRDLPAGERARRSVSWLVALTITAEMALITMQAARGTTSHFNVSTPLDGAVFGLMGLIIVANTVAVAYVAQRFWRGGASVPAPYLWGVRLGLLIFLLASLEGFVMVGLSSHSVGVADGGAGLPLVNWSTRGGDLRVAHFVGMHALQVLPLVGYLFSTRGVAGRLRRPSLWVCVVGVLYGGASALLFVQALSGLPLFSF